MRHNTVKLVFDRRKTSVKTGRGYIDLCITIDGKRTFRNYCEVSVSEYESVMCSQKLVNLVRDYQNMIKALEVSDPEFTIEDVEKRLGVSPKHTTSKLKNRVTLQSNFVDFMRARIMEEDIAEVTRGQKLTTLDSIIAFGGFKTIADLTPNNILLYDDFIRRDRSRGDTTIANYHKRLHKYANLLYQSGVLDRDPYLSVKIKRGCHKERHPLTQEELDNLTLVSLTGPKDKARDLFVFSAYTGLAHADLMKFNFNTMTEQENGIYFIDGSRVKTGTSFYTPILPPAMAILKKYNYTLPRMSDQKCNLYLHVVEAELEFHKPLTMHVGRHTFATLALDHDVDVTDVSRMLGHKNLKTTQVYAKVTHKSLHKAAQTWISNLSDIVPGKATKRMSRNVNVYNKV